VLSDLGEALGVMNTSDALNQARAAGKDLVLVTEHANPPVAKIIAISKYRYQLQQKAAEGRKKSKKQDIKEIRFTPFIGEADFQVRLRRIFEFLKHGDKVRLSLEYRGRSITKQEFGKEVFDRVFQETAAIASIEMEPKMIGKKMIAQIMPTKKGKGKPTEGPTGTPVTPAVASPTPDASTGAV
jgi:translation initiation factor IF-3